jgi:hypothetical protein
VTATDLSDQRRGLIEKIITKRDGCGRWAYDEKLARERPELRHYWPKYKSTLWTMLYLAELKAPPGDPRLGRSLGLLLDELHDGEHGIFTLGSGHFPIPCLNGNMLYLNFYFQRRLTEKMAKVIDFFDAWQRFDDGEFKTPSSHPYRSNKACYGRHSCYWGVVKLAKGLSHVPPAERTEKVRRLLGRCIDFILRHEVCYRSHEKNRLIDPGTGLITFPSVGKSDYLEILWILAREKVHAAETQRAVALLKSKMAGDGRWCLEQPVAGLVVSAGAKGRPNDFVTERAREVLAFYG